MGLSHHHSRHCLSCGLLMSMATPYLEVSQNLLVALILHTSICLTMSFLGRLSFQFTLFPFNFWTYRTTILWVLFHYIYLNRAGLSKWIWATTSSVAPTPLYLQVAQLSTRLVLLSCKSFTCKEIPYQSKIQVFIPFSVVSQFWIH